MKLNPEFMAIVEQLKLDPDYLSFKNAPDPYAIERMPIILLEDADIDMAIDILTYYCTPNSYKYSEIWHFIKHAKSTLFKDAWWRFPSELISSLNEGRPRDGQSRKKLSDDIHESFNSKYWGDIHHSLMPFKEYVRQCVAYEEAESGRANSKMIIKRFSLDGFLAKHEEWKRIEEVK